MTRVRILIADDHELVREGLIRVLIDAHADWEIVADVDDGAKAIEAGELLLPDVAILDLSMPKANGLQVTERLSARLPGIKILILTMHAAEPVVRQLRKAGASAYLLKSEAPKNLVRAVERMLANEPFFSSTGAILPLWAGQQPEHIPVQYVLTAREVEVLRLLANGRSNKELAGDLEISVRTAESHRASIMSKLGAESLAEVVTMAIRDGIV